MFRRFTHKGVDEQLVRGSPSYRAIFEPKLRLMASDSPLQILLQ